MTTADPTLPSPTQHPADVPDLINIEQYRSYKAPGLDCPECQVDTGDSAHLIGCSIGERLGCATRRREPDVFAGPPHQSNGGKTRCCGDPKNLDGGAHPWVHVSEDGPGDVYRCPECGAIDVD